MYNCIVKDCFAYLFANNDGHHSLHCHTELMLVSRSQTAFFLLHWGGEKESVTPPIVNAVLASTQVRVSDD